MPEPFRTFVLNYFETLDRYRLLRGQQVQRAVRVLDDGAPGRIRTSDARFRNGSHLRFYLG